MGDDNHGRTCLVDNLHEFIHNLRLRGHIKGRSRLVGEQEFGHKGQSHGNADSLTHTAAKLKGMGFHHALRVGQIHAGKQRAGFFYRLAFVHGAVQLEVFHKLLANGLHGIEHIAAVLKNHGNVLAANGEPFLIVQMGNITAAKVDLAALHLPVAGQAAQNRPNHRGLATAGFPDNGHNLPCLQVKIDIGHRRLALIGN